MVGGRTSLALLAALCICSASMCARAAQPDGVWMRDDGNAKVEFAPCGENYCATNLWIGDTSNGEAAGDRLIMTLKQTSSTSFIGTAYDPKRNRTYSLTMNIAQRSMTTQGCILAGLLCKKVHWTKVRAPTGSSAGDGK